MCIRQLLTRKFYAEESWSMLATIEIIGPNFVASLDFWSNYYHSWLSCPWWCTNEHGLPWWKETIKSLSISELNCDHVFTPYVSFLPIRASKVFLLLSFGEDERGNLGCTNQMELWVWKTDVYSFERICEMSGANEQAWRGEEKVIIPLHLLHLGLASFCCHSCISQNWKSGPYLFPAQDRHSTRTYNLWGNNSNSNPVCHFQTERRLNWNSYQRFIVGLWVWERKVCTQRKIPGHENRLIKTMAIY